MADGVMRETLSGLEWLRAVVAGQGAAPAMAGTLRFRLVEASEGRAVFEGEPFDGLLNPLGLVHGGWALTLIDSACGCAAHATLPAGVGYTTIETKVNFVRPVLPDTGRVRVEGRVVAAGRRIITTEAHMRDSAGKLLAHGTSTLMVLPPQSKEG
ncbi:MAG: PaaI family thioesterase [Hyphomonadaceae bacterium]